MNPLALLLCAMALAVGPAAPPPPASPPVEAPPEPPAEAATPAPVAGDDWDEATPPLEPPAEPPPPAPAPRVLPVTMVGLEVDVPGPGRGRLLERPLAVVFESERRLGAGQSVALHGGLGYAQLSRTAACRSESSFCQPLLGVTLGGLVRLGTPADRALAGWIALGAGVSCAANWDLSVVGAYARADAGLDLRVAGRHLRVAVGWVVAAHTESRPEFEPGPQRYLAFTVSAWPLDETVTGRRRTDQSAR